MKKIKGPYGIDVWIPEDNNEANSLDAIAEIQGYNILLHGHLRQTKFGKEESKCQSYTDPRQTKPNIIL